MADNYYDNKQYGQAKVLFTKCKYIVKEFKFGSSRTRLIIALMHFEMICEVQIFIAKMYDLVDQARILMDSNQKQKAISILNTAQELELQIATQFRDRKRLKDLHLRMNQLREDFYR